MGNYALIISGNALILGMVQRILTIKIKKITENLKVVVACRVSQKQKQEIVTMLRTCKPKAILSPLDMAQMMISVADD